MKKTSNFREKMRVKNNFREPGKDDLTGPGFRKPGKDDLTESGFRKTGKDDYEEER